MEVLKFEHLPSAVAELLIGQNELKSLLLSREKLQSKPDNPLNIKEVSHLAGKSKPTIYGYVQRNEIPYHKKGNRLYFFRSEIIDWIKTGKQKTLKEIAAETDAYLSNKNKGLK